MWRGSMGGPATSSARPQPRWVCGPERTRQENRGPSVFSLVAPHAEKHDAAQCRGWQKSSTCLTAPERITRGWLTLTRSHIAIQRFCPIWLFQTNTYVALVIHESL